MYSTSSKSSALTLESFRAENWSSRRRLKNCVREARWNNDSSKKSERLRKAHTIFRGWKKRTRPDRELDATPNAALAAFAALCESYASRRSRQRHCSGDRISDVAGPGTRDIPCRVSCGHVRAGE